MMLFVHDSHTLHCLCVCDSWRISILALQHSQMQNVTAEKVEIQVNLHFS